MAAATTIIAASAAIAGTAALASTGLGVGQMISGAKKKKKAQSAINQSVKDLRGMIEEGQANRLKALQVPTMGAELQERALARGTAGQVEAMQEAGAAGVIGGAGRLTQAVGEQAGQIGADLDRMQKERDKLVLTEDQRLEGQRYQGLLGLEQMELQGAQQAAADAMAQQQAGALGIGTSLGQLSSTFAGLANPYGDQTGGAKSGKKGVPKGTTTGIDPNTGKMVSLAPGYPGAQVITRPAVTSGLTSTQPQLRDPYGASFNPAISPGSFGPMATGVYSEDIYGLQTPLTQSPSSFIFNQ